MDKKKKIIVTIVTLIFVGVLAAFVKMMLFPSNTSDPSKNKISIVTPKVDERKIDRVSKIEEYTKGGLRQGDGNGLGGFGGFGEGDEAGNKRDSIAAARASAQQDSVLQLYSVGNRVEDEFDDELKGLIELQEQLIAQAEEQQQQAAATNQTSSTEELEALLKTYDDYTQKYYNNPATVTPTPATSNSGSGLTGSNSGEPSEATKKANERLANSNKEKFSGSEHFQGAGSINGNSNVVDLVPAETVDQSVVLNGSTIAIRTKKAIRLKKSALSIPKGAVVYGRVSFSANRLFIDIQSYKDRNKLYPLSFKMFDFDGREGIHLNSRTWAKIPAQVAEDVYDFIYQRGTQASAFGGAQDINLEDAQNIAILSAAREVTNQIFDKRRVLMPKKYHLWISINDNN